MIVKLSLKFVGQLWMFSHYLYCLPVPNHLILTYATSTKPPEWITCIIAASGP